MELTEPELRLWHAWKRASDAVRSRVTQDLSDAAGLSDPDFGVLSRVCDAGGSQRQNELAASMGWHRSRLSHQLTRMEERSMVQRTTVAGGVEIQITAQGMAALDTARPIHAAAVRKYLTELVPADRLESLAAELERVVDAS